MKAYDIYSKAILRLGYNDTINERLIERAPELINQINSDLKLQPIVSLGDEITAEDNAIDALCCGVAMLLALSESDAEKHKMFCNIYNCKRASVLSSTAIVVDNLPVAESGEL